MRRDRFLLVTLVFALLWTTVHPTKADTPPTTVYLPLISATAAPATTTTAASTGVELPSTLSSQPGVATDIVGVAPIQLPTLVANHHVYLPLITQGPGALADEEVNAALLSWLFPSAPTSNFSLKIEKRNFDAGGNGTNLILIPRIIDLLDLLNLTGIDAKKVWGLQNAQLVEAQALSSGAGVTVAVLDTGISLLTSELYWRTVAGYDFVDKDAYPYEAPNWWDDDRDGLVDEGSGHGTFVSSIIAASTRSARIMPIRVLNSDGNGTPEMVASGIRYAADRGVQIINLSLSSDSDNQAVRDAIAYAVNKGIVVIAAALSSSTQVGFPANYAGVIAVGAIDLNNAIPAFALGNVGAIDVFAPGVEIYGPALLGQNVWMSGNSMATAFVSAEAALLMADGRCNAACTQALLTGRVGPVTPAQGSRGRINAYQALLNRP